MSDISNTEKQFPEPISDDRDFTLENLVRFANIGYSISITLYVHGSLISGMLTSGKDYMDTVANDFESVSKQGETLASIYRGISESVYSEESMRIEDASIEYIHLKDTVIHHGSSDFKVGYWRGRINAVDGFSFGRIQK